MVHWTNAERHVIADLWGKIKPDEIGPQALARLLIVFPWNQRYLLSYGNLSNAAAILGNPKVASHGKVVINGLEKAAKNLDNIKAVYANLSELHSDTLHMDPSNYTLLADCFTVCLAAKLGHAAFTPEVHKTWQKFLNVLVAALCKQYH
ncbi:hemoglobin subunit beta-like [Tachysurus fulvidraco]|uniref:hemoglobin subunit beta-like n=1 Tax=Tachysurus fulvidraco TaxID=1234273 RepID=UPI000F4FA722|nr:hemoglobin subunit beta-like [Tachysurus fulvidraco]